MNKYLYFQTQLLEWYNHHGRKDLPWQQKGPYHVWLSEIMLQQTQVATVIAYYQRFTEAFPDIFKLANAPTDEILAMWAGLGYYHRAKNLHRTAQIIAHEYRGEFPQTPELLEKLPGIGKSTAAAILSQAFDLPYAILDGNVKRVLARFFGIETGIDETQTIKLLQNIAMECMPHTRCQEYTQAIMDMGATCCKPKNPLCVSCPLQSQCFAFLNSKVTEIPKKTQKIKRKIMRFDFNALVNEYDEVLLIKRGEHGIWPQLWCLPEGQSGVNAAHCYHDLTHMRMDIHVHLTQVEKGTDEIDGIWVKLNEPIPYGMPKPMSSLLTKIYLVLKSQKQKLHQLDPH